MNNDWLFRHCLLLLAAIVMAVPGHLEAQSPHMPAETQWKAWEPAADQLPGAWPADPSRIDGIDVVRTIGGATLGVAVGFGAAVLFLSGGRSLDGALLTGLLAAGVTMPAGAALGAHFGNRSRGRLGTVLLATAGAAVGSTLLFAAIGGDGPILIAIPVTVIGAAAATELLTTR